MGSPFALCHEQDFDLEGDVHALACFDSVSVSVCVKYFIFIWLTRVRCSDESVV